MFYDTNENSSSILSYIIYVDEKKITPTKNIMKTGREIEYIKTKQNKKWLEHIVQCLIICH